SCLGFAGKRAWATGGGELEFGVEGSAKNEDLRRVVEPQEQHHGSRDGAERGLVVAEILDIDREDRSRYEPEQRSEQGAGPDEAEAARMAVRTPAVEHDEHGYRQHEEDRPAQAKQQEILARR